MNIDQLDQNWITPAALAGRLGIPRSTVSSWIHRNRVSFIELPGATHKRYLVDTRTAPPTPLPAGRPRKE